MTTDEATEVAPPPKRRKSRFATLSANRDFRMLWLGQAGSELGGSLTTLTAPLLAVAITGSTVAAGVLGSIGFVSIWLAQLPAGYLADLVDRRTVMLWCDAIRLALMATFAVLVMLDMATLWQLLVLTVAGSALGVVFRAAQQQAIRVIVARDQIPEAVSITQARGFAISMVGPPVGGVLYAVGRALPFFANAVSYAVSMLFVWRVRTPLKPPNRPTARRLLPDMGQGWSELGRNAFLRGQTIYSAVTNLAVSALLYTVIFGHAEDSVILGMALSAAAGAGLLGSLAAPVLMRRLRLRTLLVSVALLRGAAVALATLTGEPILFAGTLTIVMFAGPVVNAALSTATVLYVDAEVMGRASSSSAFISGMLQPVAPLLAGVLLSMWSPSLVQWTLTGGFALVAICALVLPGLSLRLDGDGR
ncbi:putative MFS family arabinose efflux permease [Stackebrandtia endophytica]|uniref:Putative MFS family arabinose efflux permease n=1 Tax=Stackebrandtia endophytica TaxID=1496996 RepID=A0A543AWC0_9ACTN|nr:MFS transporter [Stackebrandtia endophytica]TQL76850.1 putative MFS family arabinose efflux permease [Stackebrandtia endophytica]